MDTEFDKLNIRMGPNQDQHQCQAGLSEGVSEGWNGDGPRMTRIDVFYMQLTSHGGRPDHNYAITYTYADIDARWTFDLIREPADHLLMTFEGRMFHPSNP